SPIRVPKPAPKHGSPLRAVLPRHQHVKQTPQLTQNPHIRVQPGQLLEPALRKRPVRLPVNPLNRVLNLPQRHDLLLSNPGAGVTVFTSLSGSTNVRVSITHVAFFNSATVTPCCSHHLSIRK